MREYVRLQTGILLRRLAIQVTRTARTGDADAIHDLRVAIRRLSRCLRVFAQFYPERSWKPVRRRLADLMDACGSVRDRDIAIGLLQQAGVPRGISAGAAVATRSGAPPSGNSSWSCKRWKARGFSRQWRVRLEL